METENIILSEVSQTQKEKGQIFSLICEDRLNTNISITLYTHKHIQNTFLKMGLLEETKRKGKEGKNDSD
jgi:hypothetical protein